MKSLKGYILILIATVFWGIAATIAKILFSQNIQPLEIAQTRVTFSAIMMFTYFLLFKREYLKVETKDLFMFLLLGIIGIAGSNFTYYFTIQQTNVATAILMQYMAPLLVFIYAAFSKSESLNLIKLSAAVLSIFGCYLVVGGKDFSFQNISRVGLLSGVASAFCWAFANVYLKIILKRYSVWTALVYSFIGGTIFWLFVNNPAIYFDKYPGMQSWYVFIIFAIISVLIPHTLYFNGLRYITPSRAIITGTFEPIVAIVSSFVLLGDILNFIQLIGAILVLTAIVILQIKKEELQEIKVEKTQYSN